MAAGTGGNARFHVDSQRPTSGIGPDGRATQGVEVQITVEGGHTASTFIPRAQFTLAEVEKRLQELANTVQAVSELGKLTAGS